VPERFGSYTLHQELGSGGMASVHLAQWRGPDGIERRVALKRLFRNVADNQELVAAFIDEGRLARYLKHPNIAQVYELGRIQGSYFIAFEYVPGPTVQQLVKQCAQHVGPIPVAVVLDIIGQLCEALDHAHNLCDELGLPLGIVHRDVTPHNLIVSNTGIVKLIDFGLAKVKYSSFESQAGIIKGKLSYIAPEYLAGALDVRCDLWAVGVVLHELLSGKKLFEAADHPEMVTKVRTMPIPRPSQFNAEVSRELDEIVMTALERDPHRRWQSASELATALDRYNSHRSQLSRSQLVRWVEWAFAQKQKLREDSGVSALTEILTLSSVEEVHDLPAIEAAVEERRRESISMTPYIGVERRQLPAWLWVVVAFGVLAVVIGIAILIKRH
jgi:serine/threonine-protein kinase